MRSKLIILLVGAALAAFPAAESGPEGRAAPGARGSIAVFALGCRSKDMPADVLGAASRAIRKVFASLGGFDAFGLRQRFSPAGAEELSDALTEARSAGSSFLPPRAFDGIAISRDAFDRLLGATFVAVPFVSRIESFYDEAQARWETEVEARVLLLAPWASPSLVEFGSAGYDASDREASSSAAAEGLARSLLRELLKREPFRSGARILAVSGAEVEIGVGRISGARKGDEYAAISDGREAGLMEIASVGPEASLARIIYSSAEIAEGTPIEEIPRIGVDVETYLHFVCGRRMSIVPSGRDSGGPSATLGLRVQIARGFRGLRPFGAVQVPWGGVIGYGSAFTFPVDLALGAEYRASRGRISIAPCAGLGAGWVYASETIRGGRSSSSEARPHHLGGMAYFDLAYLASRDVRLFAALGGEYWFSTVGDLYTDYGGVGLGAGVSIKL